MAMAAINYNSIQYLGKQSVFHSIVLYLAATSCTLTLCTRRKNPLFRTNFKDVVLHKNVKYGHNKIESSIVLISKRATNF